MKSLRYKILPVLLIVIFACYFYYGVDNVREANENKSYEITYLEN